MKDKLEWGFIFIGAILLFAVLWCAIKFINNRTLAIVFIVLGVVLVFILYYLWIQFKNKVRENLEEDEHEGKYKV